MSDFKKIELTFHNPHYIAPPGSMNTPLDHPSGRNEAVELALFQEHRYGFFYWLQWTRSRRNAAPPCLVSFDWHQDLCYPCDVEKQWLDQLNQDDAAAVAGFCWTSLNGNNDGHLLAAAYLNLIGNVYVHCRQGKLRSDWEDECFKDKFGNAHTIRKFKHAYQLQEVLLNSNEQAAYLDIDLDFFTYRNHHTEGGRAFTYMPKRKVAELLGPRTELMQWIFQRLAGFTIATEPAFCGGITKSNHLLDQLISLYFAPDLFHDDCHWKHLKGSTVG